MSAAKRQSARRPIRWTSRLLDSLTVLLSLLWLFPLVVSLWMSFRPQFASADSSALLLGLFTLDNYYDAWRISPWGTHYVNTLIFVVGTLLVQLVTVTLAAYAFARLRFPGRDLLLLLVLAQLMIPSTVLLAQNFVTIRNLGLYDSHIAMMMPYFGSAFGTLLLRQAFRSVPYELEEAARVDGANVWQVLRHVYVPLSVPSYVAFSLVSISSHWNEFLWPLIVTQSESVRPLTVGLNKLVQSSEVGALYNQQMAGTILVIAPLVLLFMRWQKQFIESFAQSGIK
ncbi:MAG: carbohydrate ABC transporter permease [Anaerolineae bacterium]|nr:carbohydrate ABC transporter permease [Anaerolineae bacterium]MDW8171125.1 carbohydrate ABC transporter permease [Anaerolineae bacterium]